MADAQNTSKHCIHGHALTPDNLIRTDDRERCRECQCAARRKWYATHGAPLRTREHVPSLIGQRFGRWTVKERAPDNTPEGKSRWHCRCDCGNEKIVTRATLKSGLSQSCGCYAKAVNTLHGMSDTPTYRSWAGIMRRCVWELDFEGYSARGIKVCDRWQVFAAFLEDMNERPEGKSVDRYPDNNGHYSCGKCEQCQREGWPLNARWATATEQMNNTRVNHLVTWQGKTQSLAQWERELMLSRGIIASRLLRGWTTERAMTTP